MHGFSTSPSEISSRISDTDVKDADAPAAVGVEAWAIHPSWAIQTRLIQPMRASSGRSAQRLIGPVRSTVATHDSFREEARRPRPPVRVALLPPQAVRMCLSAVAAPHYRSDVELFSRSWAALRTVVAELPDEDFVQPSGCRQAGSCGIWCAIWSSTLRTS